MIASDETKELLRARITAETLFLLLHFRKRGVPTEVATCHL